MQSRSVGVARATGNFDGRRETHVQHRLCSKTVGSGMKRKHRPSDLTAHAETSPRDSANKCNAPTSRDISPKGSTRSPLEDGYSTIARSPQDSPLLSKCKKRKKRNVDGGGNDKDDQLDAAGKMNSDGHSQQESRVEENSDQLNIKGRSSAGRETTRSEGCPNEAAVPEEKEEGAMEVSALCVCLTRTLKSIMK